MSLISDIPYALHTLRLTHLRHNSTTHQSSSPSSSNLTPSQRIISLSHSALVSNPYIQATGLGDVDLWPEIAGGVDSPDGSIWGGDEAVDSGDERRQGSPRFGERSRVEKGKSKATDQGQEKDQSIMKPSTRAPPNRSKSGDDTSLQLRDRDPTVSLKYSHTIGRQSHLGMGGIRINGLEMTSGEGSKTIMAGRVQERESARAPPTGTTSRLSFSSTPNGTTTRGGDSVKPSPTRNLRDRSRSSTVGEYPTVVSDAHGGLVSSPGSERTPTGRTLSDLSTRSPVSETRPPVVHGYTSPPAMTSPPASFTPRAPSGLETAQVPPPAGTPQIGARHPSLSDRFLNRNTMMRRPRADSAPMVVVSSPPGRITAEKEVAEVRKGSEEVLGSISGAGGSWAQDQVGNNSTTTRKKRDRRGGSFAASTSIRPQSAFIPDQRAALNQDDLQPIIGSIRDFFGPTAGPSNRQSFIKSGLIGGGGDGAYGVSALGKAMMLESTLAGQSSGLDMGMATGLGMGNRSGRLSRTDTAFSSSDMQEDGDGDTGSLLDDGEFHTADEDDGYGGEGETNGKVDMMGEDELGFLPAGVPGLDTALGSLVDPEMDSDKIERDKRGSMDYFAPVKMVFEKRSLAGVAPAPARTQNNSGLTKLFRPASTISSGPANGGNPFFVPYASVPYSEGSAVPSLSLVIFFPRSKTASKPIRMTIRKDVTVEEVIGWACSRYWEEGRTPGLDAEHEEGENREMDPGVWLSTVGWALRIVEDEDDGEVDEDFPALDREAQIAKFSFNAFAVVEASNAQIRQNLSKQPLKPTLTPQLSGRSTRANSLGATSSAVTPMERAQSTASMVAGTYAGGRATTIIGGNPLAPGLGISSATMGGVMVTLRIKVISAADSQVTTSISVSSDMYFADIIELLIRKQQLSPHNPSEWVLVLADLSMALPLDRTVESLMGNVSLALVRKQWAERRHLVSAGKGPERRGGDPSTSIFKRPAEPSRGPGVSDIVSGYRKYIVQRKMPIGRHERIFAIDGDYIHIMPTDNKGFFDSMKTSSFHITSVDTCKQNSKHPTNFKMMVVRDAALKRYDFEAESGRQAGEIIATLQALMKIYQADKVPVPPPASRGVRRRG